MVCSPKKLERRRGLGRHELFDRLVVAVVVAGVAGPSYSGCGGEAFDAEPDGDCGFAAAPRASLGGSSAHKSLRRPGAAALSSDGLGRARRARPNMAETLRAR